MNERKSTISQASSYKEIGDFWDTHDLADYWDQTERVDFEVDIESEATYYALDKELSQMLSEVAEERGVSAETLLNLWVQEKLWKDASPETA
jgi:glutathionylspermidine synthase